MKYAIKITFTDIKGKKKVHYWGAQDRPRLNVNNNFKPYTQKERAEDWGSYLKSGEYYPIYKNSDMEIIEFD